MHPHQRTETLYVGSEVKALQAFSEVLAKREWAADPAGPRQMPPVVSQTWHPSCGRVSAGAFLLAGFS